MAGSIAGLAAFALIWFSIAGRADWVQGWAFLVAFVTYVGLLVWRVSRVDPDLVEERNRQAENVEPWDKAVMGVYMGLLVILLVVTALDGGRYGWSAVHIGIQVLGWGLLVAAGAIIWHVMTVNAYLSSWARIQEDRGQVVVAEGLYGVVRHPMYLGIVIGFLGMPLALASWWALLPALAIGAAFVYRTAREDLMLHGKLPGYDEYAQKVRYRLIPGLW